MAREPGERLSLLSTRRCPAKKTERWRERSSFSAQVSVFASWIFPHVRRLQGRLESCLGLYPRAYTGNLFAVRLRSVSLSSRHLISQNMPASMLETLVAQRGTTDVLSVSRTDPRRQALATLGALLHSASQEREKGRRLPALAVPVSMRQPRKQSPSSDM